MYDFEIEELISVRSIARKDGNIAMARKVEAELAEEGVILLDSPYGTTWEAKDEQ